MPTNDPEYQRKYRARKKAERLARDRNSPVAIENHENGIQDAITEQERVTELERENAALREEIARLTIIPEPDPLFGTFGHSRPAPKPGRK